MRAIRFSFVLAVAFCAASFAQQQPTAPPGTEPPGTVTPQKPPEKKPDTNISEKDAKCLFQQVDDILSFVSRDTGLPIKHPVKRELASREQVRKYVTEKRDDEDIKRLERTGIVLKKLGLLPRDFDLGTYLSALLEEQIAGYYDAKTKTVYLLDWIEPDAQKPVLAHELTHALQDQNYDLEKFLKTGMKQEDVTSALKANHPFEIHADESGTARQALVEGQAMVVLVDYMLAPSGHTLADSPLIGDMVKASAQKQSDEFPVMSRAPMYLRDSLIFPYTYGMDFVEAMLRRGSKEDGFAAPLKDPPHSTREVMEPRAYTSKEQIAPITLPDMRKVLGKDYEPYDVGNLGEFDVHSVLKQFSGAKTADKLAPHWRGGAYYAAERTSGPAGKKTDCGAKPSDPKLQEAQRVACLAMLVETRWENTEAARQFAERYASLLLVKYKFAQDLADESGKPPPGDPRREDPNKARTRCFECLGGERWMTDEGIVTIQQRAETVLVLETFDDAVTPKLQQAALPQAAPPSTVHSPQ